MPVITRCPLDWCNALHFVGHEHAPGKHRAEVESDLFSRPIHDRPRHRAQGMAQ